MPTLANRYFFTVSETERCETDFAAGTASAVERSFIAGKEWYTYYYPSPEQPPEEPDKPSL